MDRIRTIGTSGVVLRTAATLAIGVMGVAACGPPAQERAADQTVDTVAEPAAETAPGVDTTPMMDTAPVATQQVVTVRVSDGGLVVEPTTVRPGATTFHVTNSTSVPYDIDIDGPGPDREIENLPAGESRQINMTLMAGTYEIEANAERDPEREREVYLTVRE